MITKILFLAVTILIIANSGQAQNSILTEETNSLNLKKSLTTRQLWIVTPTPVYFYSMRTVSDNAGNIFQEIDTSDSWILYPNTKCIGKSRTSTDTSLTVVLSSNNPIRRSREKNCYMQFSSTQLCSEWYGVFRLRTIGMDTITVSGKACPAVWVALGKKMYLVQECEWINLFVGYERLARDPKDEGFKTFYEKKYQSKETVAEYLKGIFNK